MKPNAEKDAALVAATSALVAPKITLLKSIAAKTDPSTVTAAEASDPANWVACDYTGYVDIAVATTDMDKAITAGSGSGTRQRQFPEVNTIDFEAIDVGEQSYIVGAVLWESDGGGTLTTTPKRIALRSATTLLTEGQIPQIPVDGWTAIES